MKQSPRQTPSNEISLLLYKKNNFMGVKTYLQYFQNIVILNRLNLFIFYYYYLYIYFVKCIGRNKTFFITIFYYKHNWKMTRRGIKFLRFVKNRPYIEQGHFSSETETNLFINPGEKYNIEQIADFYRFKKKSQFYKKSRQNKVINFFFLFSLKKPLKKKLVRAIKHNNKFKVTGIKKYFRDINYLFYLLPVKNFFFFFKYEKKWKKLFMDYLLTLPFKKLFIKKLLSIVSSALVQKKFKKKFYKMQKLIIQYFLLIKSIIGTNHFFKQLHEKYVYKKKIKIIFLLSCYFRAFFGTQKRKYFFIKPPAIKLLDISSKTKKFFFVKKYKYYKKVKTKYYKLKGFFSKLYELYFKSQVILYFKPLIKLLLLTKLKRKEIGKIRYITKYLLKYPWYNEQLSSFYLTFLTANFNIFLPAIERHVALAFNHTVFFDSLFNIIKTIIAVKEKVVTLKIVLAGPFNRHSRTKAKIYEFGKPIKYSVFSQYLIYDTYSYNAIFGSFSIHIWLAYEDVTQVNIYIPKSLLQ